MQAAMGRWQPFLSRRFVRLVLVSGGTLVCVSSFGTAAASADQSIQVAAAPSSAIDGTATTITVTGSTATGGSVYADLDSSGTSCGSNPGNDPGPGLISGDGVDGPVYSDTTTTTPSDGSYVVCAWLMPAGDDGSGTPLAGPVSAPLTITPVQATVTLSAPVSVTYLQRIPVRIDWQANGTGALFVDVLPSSYGPCTADPADEPQYVGWLTGQGGYTNNDPIGQSATGGTSQYVAGEYAPDTYQVCAWIEEPTGTVVAGPVAVDVRMLPLPGSRTYSGRTSQDLPIKVTVVGYTVQDIVYSARFNCGTSEYFSTGLRWNGLWKDSVLTAANFGALRLLRGTFKTKLDANPANQVRLHGTVNGDSLSGGLKAFMRVGPPQFRRAAACRTGNVRFAIRTGGSRRRSTPRRHARRR